jgi:hypothetical protein
MKYVYISFVFTVGCATSPKCGNPAGASTVYATSKTCEIRIRQIVVGSKMRIPESLKGPNLTSHELTWTETSLVDGKIQFGHFVLVPKTTGGSHEQ